MKLEEIRNIPTTTSGLTVDTDFDYSRMHESVLRSFHIVDKIEELLKKGTPPDVIIEIIDDLKNATSIKHYPNNAVDGDKQ